MTDEEETQTPTFDEWEDDTEFPVYVPIVPNRTFFVRTRYVYRGRGKPLPFDWVDE